MNRVVFFTLMVILICALTPTTTSARRKNTKDNSGILNVTSSNGRNGRYMSLFHIVRFKADPCTVGREVGICLTDSDCQYQGGVKLGNCAAGA